MSKPPCFNRPPYKDTVVVQDGWENYEYRADCTERIKVSRRPRMVEIPDPMTKGCPQNTPPFGEAYRDNWDCEGCRWKTA